MPKHIPIKFETTLEPCLKKLIVKTIKENPRAKSVVNTTLGIIAIGGVLTFGVALPAALAGVGRLLLIKRQSEYEQYREIWKRFHYLKQQHKLKFIKKKDGYMIYHLTTKGKKRIKKLLFDEMRISKPKKWDKKWRLVIFDIPESKRKTRVLFQKKLKELELYQCQKSVWIHPFPCLEEIEFFKDMLNIKSYVKLFTVDEMTDGKVLYHFKNLIREVVVKHKHM